jgi:Holliday junction DNA helicase RuvA
MIAYLNGKLAYKDPTFVIIDVGGVGYEVKISLSTYSYIKDKEEVLLQTYMHVKEDAHTLFGFSDIPERKRFLDLISISGVGPSTGLMILSSLSPEELQQAIIQEDVKTIQGVKGIGVKTAQRIILELKDKMKKEGILDLGKSSSSQPRNTLRDEALSALVTLGIPKANAMKQIDLILAEKGQDITLEELIKFTLKRA